MLIAVNLVQSADLMLINFGAKLRLHCFTLVQTHDLVLITVNLVQRTDFALINFGAKLDTVSQIMLTIIGL